MTDADRTGLTALPETLRALSMQSGIVRADDARPEAFLVAGPGGVVENLRSGQDVLVLPHGTDLSTVRVENGWQDEAWGLRVSYGAGGGDSVFLRWGWQFDAGRDLATAGPGAAPDADGGTDGGPDGGTDGEVVAPPAAQPGPGAGLAAGSGADALRLEVSGESYRGDAQFTVQVNGRQVGGTFTAGAQHGEGSDTLTLRGDWGDRAEVTVTFVNDLWDGTAATDRNLHIEGATYNGAAIAGAAQTVWGDYGVSFATGAVAEAPGGTDGGTPPQTGGGTPPPAGGGTPSGGAAPAGYTLVLQDDFSNGYRYENWGNPFDGGTYWNGAFTWSDDDVAVRDGEMQVTITDHGGWWTAGGFSSFKAGNTITYGKIAFDAKVPEAQGTMAAILTWPASDRWPADGEIDILETPHRENMFSSHWEGPDGQHWYDSKRSSSYDAAEWHHYEVTWLPDRLSIEVDGTLMAEWTDPAAIPDVAHGFGAMGFVGAPFDSWMGGAPDASTPDRITISLDNVRMYQADGIF